MLRCVVEQGLSLTVIVAPHPLEGDAAAWDGRRDFISAHRVWLGGLSGTDWLHEAAEGEFGPLGWHDVASERHSKRFSGALPEISTAAEQESADRARAPPSNELLLRPPSASDERHHSRSTVAAQSRTEAALRWLLRRVALAGE